MKNKITIVVPCKNEETYIAHLLNALKNQEGIEGVQIIIADISDDNTRQVIKENRKGLRVKVIKGGPVSKAKNSGASLVKTPYVLFIDADVRFFSSRTILDTVEILENENLDLIGLNAKCYDNSIRAKIAFGMFNIVNKILSNYIPFAVGAYTLTRMAKFKELGGYNEKYATSEDFHLSRKYDLDKFKLVNHYYGQDSRRFKQMGYFGMSWYLINNFINRDNEAHWKTINEEGYWKV
jgi:glycosyltransferase involved in cell wall biosynthesis